MQRKEYIEGFLKEFEYPEEAARSLLNAYMCIFNNEDARREYDAKVREYESDTAVNTALIANSLTELAEKAGISWYEIQLLYYISISQKLRELYEKNGYSYEMFYSAMCDLKYKAKECFGLHGIWGSFTRNWFHGFYSLERFAFGRLQFDFRVMGEEQDINGIHLGKDDTVINVHIPSSGPLDRDECLEAYKQAHEFFAEYRFGGVTVFHCHSWLLHPALKKILPEHSNIIKFQSDYTIMAQQDTERFNDLWRVFNVPNETAYDELPEGNSLKSGIKRWLCDGNRLGYGRGVFCFDGKSIIR